MTITSAIRLFIGFLGAAAVIIIYVLWNANGNLHAQLAIEKTATLSATARADGCSEALTHQTQQCSKLQRGWANIDRAYKQELTTINSTTAGTLNNEALINPKSVQDSSNDDTFRLLRGFTDNPNPAPNH